jgi:hypothetical protein
MLFISLLLEDSDIVAVGQNAHVDSTSPTLGGDEVRDLSAPAQVVGTIVEGGRFWT